MKHLPIHVINHRPNPVELLLPLAKHHTTSHNIPVVLTGRDFPKHIGAPRLHTVRDGNRPTDEGLHSLPSKRDSLLSARGNPGIVEHKYLTAGELLLHLVGNIRVISTATTHKHLVDLVNGIIGGVSLPVINDGLGRNMRNGSDNVIGKYTKGLAFLN